MIDRDLSKINDSIRACVTDQLIPYIKGTYIDARTRAAFLSKVAYRTRR